MEPWNDPAEETLTPVLPPGLPAAALGDRAVGWSLGANLIASLDPTGGGPTRSWSRHDAGRRCSGRCVSPTRRRFRHGRPTAPGYLWVET